MVSPWPSTWLKALSPPWPQRMSPSPPRTSWRSNTTASRWTGGTTSSPVCPGPWSGTASSPFPTSLVWALTTWPTRSSAVTCNPGSAASGSRRTTGMMNIRGPGPGAETMKITDLRCAVIGRHPIVRIVTDEGLYGLGEVEFTKSYLKPWVLHFHDALLGEDPTDVERCMLKIRQRGGFKPYGAAVTAIAHALWDMAGKAANVPAYKLLGGKVRDKVRVYNGSIRQKRTGDRPEDYAADVKWMMEQPQNFFMVKQGISFHSDMKDAVDDFHYGVRQTKSGYHGAMDQGQISERGFNHMLDCVAAMKEVLGDKVSLALDCGPGWFLNDAIRFARAVERYDLMWLEDMLTGDYVPWVNPQAYRELTVSTSTPIHTGEQIYSRHNFKELIETQAVRVVGPDPADVGGI